MQIAENYPSPAHNKSEQPHPPPLQSRAFAFAVAVALAFLAVIPAGNLLLAVAVAFAVSRCPCRSGCHSRRESAVPHPSINLHSPPPPKNQPKKHIIHTRVTLTQTE